MLELIIRNDRQIYRVIIEKGLPLWQGRDFGLRSIRKFGTWKFVRHYHQRDGNREVTYHC
jgi:hypothetical protein